MTYKLDFLEEALAEWNKLNPSIKLVYEVIDDEVIFIVIAVGRRENNAVYDEANSRHS